MQTDTIPGGAFRDSRPFDTQAFGRIEAIRPDGEETEIDIRRPDGRLMTAQLHPETDGTGADEAVIGRNIWVSGREGPDVIRADAVQILEEE